MSTRKGRTYENYIKEYCWKLGLRASRRVLSGSNLKSPYDVLISKTLRVEAKRRLKKDALTFDGEWLEELGKNDILVFTAGKTPGIKLRLLAVFPMDLPYEQWVTINELSGPTVDNTIEVVKSKTIKAEVFDHTVYLKHGKKVYAVMPLKDYLLIHGYLQQFGPFDHDVMMLGPRPDGVKVVLQYKYILKTGETVVAGRDVTIGGT